jgi:hypothetical protein
MDSLGDRVAAIFDERGWGILELEDGMGRVCAAGAVFVAAELPLAVGNWSDGDHLRWGDSFECRVWDTAQRITLKRFSLTLTTYNDNKARTVDDVIQIIREAEKEVIADDAARGR